MAEDCVTDWVDARVKLALDHHNCNFHQNEDFDACNREDKDKHLEDSLRKEAIGCLKSKFGLIEELREQVGV